MGCVAFEETLANIRGYNFTALVEEAVKQGVILPLLNEVGWNTRNIDEVKPELWVGEGLVDYALRIKDANRVFVEAKSGWDSLQGGEGQLLKYCRAGKPDLAVLTNGRRWKLYLPPTRGKDAQLRLFLDFDLTSLDPTKVQENFERFLARGKVETKTAITGVVKEAKRLFDKRRGRDAAFRQMTAAWNSLTIDQVGNFLAPLAGYHPDDEVVKDFLDSVGVPSLVKQINGEPEPPQPRKPHSFTFQGGDAIPVKSEWYRLLVGFCLLMHDRHPGEFRTVLLAMPKWFTESDPGSDEWPKAIGDTGIYAHFGVGKDIKRRCAVLLEKFGHPLSDLTIKSKSGVEIPLNPP